MFAAARATLRSRPRVVAGSAGVRTELVFAVLRGTAAIVSIVTLLTQGAYAGPLKAPVLWHALFLATSVVPVLLLRRCRSTADYRWLAVGVTAFDTLFYAGFQLTFSSVNGMTTLVGLLIVIEGPVRFGWLGLLATGVPVATVASLWPQADGGGHHMDALATIIVVALFSSAAALAVGLARRAGASGRLIQEQFEVAFEQAAIGIALLGGGGRVLQANPAMRRLLGLPASSEPHAAFPDLVAADSRPMLWTALDSVLAKQPRGARLEVRLSHDVSPQQWARCVLTPLKSMGPGHGTDQRRVLVQLEDITGRKAEERQLSDLARRDSLTGLGNRLALIEMVEHALRGPDARRCTLLFVDVDRFKQINDLLGHAAGDTALIAVAGRLSAAIRPGDFVTRCSGDEFIVLCRDVETSEQAVAVAERVIETLRAPILIANGEVHVRVSIGIAMAHSAGDSAESLIANADLAMYRAKESGGNRCEVFNQALRIAVQRHHEVEARLRRDLLEDALEVHYQPMVDLRTGTYSGVEALLRWSGTERAGMSIGEVVEIAEESDLIVSVGQWVLATCLGEGMLANADLTLDGGLRLSVNVSTRELLRPTFIAHVQQLLVETGTEPGQLCIEVTETSLAESIDAIIEPLHELRRLGVRLAIDDFGTGHASLTYLARFPVDVVKVDRSFVGGLGIDPTSGVIVRSVIAMAHALGMEVVAEGVETLGQLEVLLEAGCDFGQGYLFARPLPARACAEALANAVPWPVPLSGRRSHPDGVVRVPPVDPARRYRLLLELARTITGSRGLEDVLSATFAALRQLVRFTGGSIQLVDDGSLFLAATDPPATIEAAAAKIPLGQGVGGRIAVTGEPRYIPDIRVAPDVTAGRRQQNTSGGVCSYFGVPLIAEGEVIGVVQIDSVEADAFSEEDRFTVLAFTPIVALAVQTARIIEEHTDWPRPTAVSE